MTLNIKDIIVLEDNKEYVITSKINYNNKIFYYLIDTNQETVMVCQETNNNLIEINDENIIKELLPLFIEKALPEYEINENN